MTAAATGHSDRAPLRELIKGESKRREEWETRTTNDAGQANGGDSLAAAAARNPGIV